MKRTPPSRIGILVAIFYLAGSVTVLSMEMFGIAGLLVFVTVFAVGILVGFLRIARADQPAAPIQIMDNDAPAHAAVTEPDAARLPAEAPRAASTADAESGREHTPDFDFEAFQHDLLLDTHPAMRLRKLLASVEERIEAGESVSGAERFLARQLREAGLDDHANKLPVGRVVCPRHSGMFYMREEGNGVSWNDHLRLLRVEAALNALGFANELTNLASAEEEDVYRAWQRTIASVCAQAPHVDTANWSFLAMPWQVPFGPTSHGEWAVRSTLSEAVEEVRVPFRLEARFRSNVAGGDVALEFRATPADAFPASSYVPALGIVPTTRQMREREASKYAARVGLLLASSAFVSSEHIRRVWVAAKLVGPSTTTRLYSVCMERKAFSRLRLDRMDDPLAVLRTLGATLHEKDGALGPAEALFYLEDARFCPPLRHDIWQLSERALPAAAARSLGTARVSGLSIYESLPRTVAGENLVDRLMDEQARKSLSTEEGVQAVLDIAGTTSDLSVWSAAERVAGKLVDGVLDVDNVQAVRDELVEGDDLTVAVRRSQSLLADDKPQEALRVLRRALAPLDRGQYYRDSMTIAYRCFDSFAERVLYNRLHADDTRSVELVPDHYLMARLTMAALLAALPSEMGGNAEEALRQAQLALEAAPLSTSPNLSVAACLELLERSQEAQQQLKDYLDVAFHPQSVAIAYLRLGSLLWKDGNKRSAQACLQRSAQVCPPFFPLVMGQLHELLSEEDGEDTYEIELLDEKAVEESLKDEHIPLAPTPHTAFHLFDAATASVDAEVFPVARDLLQVLESLTGDDVIRGIRASIEREPDV